MLERRELSTRKIPFFHQLAKAMVQMGLTPNMISVASLVFAMLAGFSFMQLREARDFDFFIWVFLSFLGIQLRLLCNMLDGLMAVEGGGKKTVTGDIYNDFPDRISDAVILFGAGLAIPFAWGKDLGWLMALLAVMTAYVRLLGTSLGCGQDYGGPLAKQHRMGLLNIILVLLMMERILFGFSHWSLIVGLPILAFGTFVTVLARLQRMVKKLNLKK